MEGMEQDNKENIRSLQWKRNHQPNMEERKSKKSVSQKNKAISRNYALLHRKNILFGSPPCKLLGTILKRAK